MIWQTDDLWYNKVERETVREVERNINKAAKKVLRPTQEQRVVQMLIANPGKETWFYQKKGLEHYITDVSRILRRLKERGLVYSVKSEYGKCNEWHLCK